MQTIISFNDELSREELDAVWHIFCIEDIVAHALISEDERVFAVGNYRKRINLPIIITGNELVKQ